jgi:hypothetical protein
MKNEFVPYNLAIQLKELGFDEPCFGWWFADEEMLIIDKSTKSTSENIIQAPLFQQVFRWFRETYNLHSCVAPVYEDETKKVILYWFWIQGFDDFDSENIDYKTPEEAELACLIKLIEIVKDEK